MPLACAAPPAFESLCRFSVPLRPRHKVQKPPLYGDRGRHRKWDKLYAKDAGLPQSISPHKLRHFLFTWLKKQGIADALIQPYSGHERPQSLEVYSKLSITDAQTEYENVIHLMCCFFQVAPNRRDLSTGPSYGKSCHHFLLQS